jgi:hypothetical protein
VVKEGLGGRASPVHPICRSVEEMLVEGGEDYTPGESAGLKSQLAVMLRQVIPFK